MMTKNSRNLSVAAVALALGLGATGCSNNTTSSGSGGPAAAGANPSVAASTSAAGNGCTRTKLGYPSVNMKGAKVGFSQSEPETAAFRIAETQSMVDEAAKQGATLNKTDANSQIAKQVTDIQGMINQGVQLLIVAPLNPDPPTVISGAVVDVVDW